MTYNFDTLDEKLTRIEKATKDELKLTIFEADMEDYEAINSMDLKPEEKEFILRTLKNRTWIELGIVKKLGN